MPILMGGVGAVVAVGSGAAGGALGGVLPQAARVTTTTYAKERADRGFDEMPRYSLTMNSV